LTEMLLYDARPYFENIHDYEDNEIVVRADRLCTFDFT
jgi:hypothetical protein